MRLPIQYALTWPHRYPLDLEKPLDLTEVATLHFAKPDLERFPLLALAYEAGKKGGNLPAVMNAANEVANAAFRKKQISFLEIEDIVINAVHTAVSYTHLDVYKRQVVLRWLNVVETTMASAVYSVETQTETVRQHVRLLKQKLQQHQLLRRLSKNGNHSCSSKRIA